MRKRMAALGSQSLDLPEGVLRGHTFHHSSLDCPLEPLGRAHYPDGRPGEPVYRLGSLTASYVHAYFPSNPAAVCRLFNPALAQAGHGKGTICPL
jgi:cobyrinic acid a,c-diamide synthase